MTMFLSKGCSGLLPAMILNKKSGDLLYGQIRGNRRAKHYKSLQIKYLKQKTLVRCGWKCTLTNSGCPISDNQVQVWENSTEEAHGYHVIICNYLG
jgi:hypothetical protein